MKTVLVSLLSAALVAFTARAEVEIEAPAGTYKLDPTHASLIWKVNHLGLSDYTARFTAFDATLAFDPGNITDSRLDVTVDPMSVETDYPKPKEKDFDKKLQTSENFFNAGQYPQIMFTSTKIEKTGERSGKVHGELTMLGETQPVTLDVTFNGSMAEHPYADVAALGFSAEGTLRRSQWGMDYLVPNVGDEVKLLIEAEFLRQE